MSSVVIEFRKGLVEPYIFHFIWILTVFRIPLTCTNLPSEINLDRSLSMHSSKSTVLPLPVGAEITMFTSEW